MAEQRNVRININDTSPLPNTAYVESGLRSNKTYNQEQIDSKISNSIDGIALTSIKPTTLLTELNALPNTVYRAFGEGTYQFNPALQIVEGSAVNVIPPGYSVKFLKDASGWNVSVVEKIPSYDDSEIFNRINDIELNTEQFKNTTNQSILEVRQDQQDFIENFSIEVDQNFNPSSDNPQSGNAVLQAVSNVNFGFIDEINSLSQLPTLNGVYTPKIEGVYVNFGNLEYVLGEGFVVFTKNGNSFTKSVVPLDINFAEKIDITKTQLAINSKTLVDNVTLKINNISELRNTQGEFEGQVIELLGYYDVNDEAPTINYVWVNEVTENDNDFQINVINQGSWKALTTSVIDFANLGVVNGYDDGNRLNTVLRDVALFNGKQFTMSNPLNISTPIKIYESINIKSLKLITDVSFTSKILDIISNNVEIDYLEIDGKEINNYGVNLQGGSIKLHKVNIQNLHEINGVTGVNTYGVYVHSASVLVEINGGLIKNIKSYENNVNGDTQGAGRGVLIRGGAVVRNLNVEDVIGYEDSDSIHVQSVLDVSSQSWSKLNVLIDNCVIRNIGKSGIKLQCSGVDVVNNKIYSDTTDYNCPHAGIRDYGSFNNILSNIIRLKRAKAAIILGAQGNYDGSNIQFNNIRINEDNLYTDTSASNKIMLMSFERPIVNCKINNNIFTGYAQIGCTPIQQIVNSFISNNEFYNGYIRLYYANDVDAKIVNTQINRNKFHFTNSSTSDPTCILLNNPNGVNMIDNEFTNINRTISILGVVGENGVVYKNIELSVLNPLISTSNVTNGLNYINKISTKSFSIESSDNSRLESVSSLDADLMRGNKTLLVTDGVNTPQTIGILTNYDYNDNASVQFFVQYSSSDRYYMRRKASGVFSEWIKIIQSDSLASLSNTGVVKQSATVVNTTTADATDLATALTLVNELKAKHNDLLAKLKSAGIMSNT